VLTRFPTFASWMNEANDARTADISSCATSTPFGSTNSSRERVASSLVARRVPSLVSLLVPVVCPLSCVCVFVCLCLCARAPLSLSHSDVRRQRDRRLLHVRLSTVSSRTSRTSPREQSVSRVRVRRHVERTSKSVPSFGRTFPFGDVLRVTRVSPKSIVDGARVLLVMSLSRA
jgi:hypothetical protein